MSKILLQRNSVWPFWVLATSISSTLGFMIGNHVMNALIEHYHDALVLVAYLATPGLFIGAGQWIILRYLHKRAKMWIIATAIGFSIGFSVTFWIYPSVPGQQHTRLFFWLFSSIIVGLVVGILQWIALHRILRGSFVWLLVSGLSWGIGMTISVASYRTYFEKINGLYGDLIFGALIGSFVGILSGVFVARYLASPDLQGLAPYENASYR